MSKASRHKTILTLLGQRPAASQYQLQAALLKRGIQVGQATLSRDIQTLGLIKSRGGYRPPCELASPIIVRGIIAGSVVGVRAVQNLLILKTLDGDGRPVAATLEEENWPEAIRTLACEDTVLIVCNDNRGARKLAARIRAQCSDLKVRGTLGWWAHAVGLSPASSSCYPGTPLPLRNPSPKIPQASMP